MEDLLEVDKIQFIIETYKEIREKFHQGGTYDPHAENKYFAETYLNTEDPNTIECTDLFFGYVHALFIIQSQEGNGDWEMSVGNLIDFLSSTDEIESYLVPGKEAILTWVQQLDMKVEIPY